MLNIKEFRNKDELALPDLLNPAILVGEILVQTVPAAVIMNKDGSFLTCLQFRGPDNESMSPAELARLSALFNTALTHLGAGWSIQDSAIRVPSTTYIPESDNYFTDPVSLAIDAERRAQFEAEGLHFETHEFLAITWHTPPESEVQASRAFVVGTKESPSDTFDMLLKKFEGSVNSFCGMLRPFKIYPLGASGALSHYHECLTGKTHAVNPPPVGAYLDVLLGHHDFVAGLEPQIDGEYIETITVTGYPVETVPDILELLHNLPFPLRYTTRLILIEQGESKKLIAKYREKWASSKYSLHQYLSAASEKGQLDPARADKYKAGLEAETSIAESDISSGTVKMGYFTMTIILRDKNSKTLESRTQIIKDLLENAGFIPKKETVNAVEAFLGSLPGHTWENVRRPVLSTINYADLSPKTAVWPGEPVCPSPLMQVNKRPAPPLCFAQTTGTTPYRLNLHVSDVGHSLLIGPTGSGKSSLLALLANQWLRFKDSRVISFDYHRSMFALCNAVGGQHYDIGGDRSDLTFAPLSRIDSQSDKLFAASWLKGLAVLQGVNVTAKESKQIQEAIESLSHESGRSVTDVFSMIQNESLKQAFEIYTGTGTYSDLVDARSDGLDLQDSRFTTFELGNLPKGDKGISVPVLLYLFHRIESMLDGRPTLIPLDESWVMLDDPLFLATLREWLKTLRKKNAVVIFATQSLADLKDSPLLQVLKESCKTKIYLPNEEAESEGISTMYRNFDLTAHQIELLAKATPKQDYYITSPLGRRMVSFGMGPLTLAFCAVSDPKEVDRVAQLVQEHGDTWTVAWLKERGVSADWIAYLDNLYRQRSAA